MKSKQLRRRPAPPKSALTAARERAANLVREQPALYEVKRSHPLGEIFRDALAQATRGKGDARHGQGRDSSDPDNFLRQDWREISRRHGPAFLSGQAEKKLREALALAHPERRTELLGVMVYVGMLVLHHDMGGG